MQTFGFKSLVSRLGLGKFKSRSRLEFLAIAPPPPWLRYWKEMTILEYYVDTIPNCLIGINSLNHCLGREWITNTT